MDIGKEKHTHTHTVPEHPPKGVKRIGPAPGHPGQPLVAKESHVHTKPRRESFKYHKQHYKPTLGSWIKRLNLGVCFDSESCSCSFQHSPANLHNPFKYCLSSVTLHH